MPNLSRRQFLSTVPGLIAGFPLRVDAGADPLLDFHQHTHYNGRPNEYLIAHQANLRVTKTVLLPGEGWMLSIVGGNRECAGVEARYPDRFVRFACSDPIESRTPDVLQGNVRRGACGFGEMKFHVAVDSPEMHRVYKLAEELNVPVLLHFEYETYNTGLDRFVAVLKAYPSVHFIGHAQTWWGNISTDLNPLDLYPKGPVKPGGLTDRLLGDYPNVYGDLSAESGLNALTRDTDFARGFIERHRQKLIWGSDCDCYDGQGDGVKRGYCIAARALKALRGLVSGDALFRQIVYENGARLLGSQI